jgi:hypothetical protein
LFDSLHGDGGRLRGEPPKNGISEGYEAKKKDGWELKLLKRSPGHN